MTSSPVAVNATLRITQIRWVGDDRADRALDLTFGPDPLPCDQRDGPLPDASGGLPVTPVTGGVTSPPGAPDLPAAPAAGSGDDQVGTLLVPLLQTRPT